jgi:RNA ligase (TIGR02306 family)
MEARKRENALNIAARILPVISVADVPKADRLSVVTILGYQAVVAKNPDGSHVHSPGQRVVYVPEGMTVPDDLLKQHGFWGPNPETGVVQGTLAGPRGSLIRPMTLRKQLSTGLVWDVPAALEGLPDGTDVSAHYGLTEWVPEIPQSLLRMAMPLYEAKNDYAIARLKMYPNFFRDGEEVVVTEKLHGECLQATWLGGRVVAGLHGGGTVALTTKGMARSGYAFRDVEESRKVPIIRAARKADIVERLIEMVRSMGAEHSRVRLYAEAVGAGVQKMHYGEAEPNARGIDLRVEERWLQEDEKSAVFADGGLARVPVLYRGPFDHATIDALREGATTMGGKHDREGVVVTSTGPQDRRLTELGDSIRPSLKYHSDRFLRKFGIED